MTVFKTCYLPKLDRMISKISLRLFCIAAVRLHIIGPMYLLLRNLLVPTEQQEDLMIPKDLSIAHLADLKYL